MGAKTCGDAVADEDTSCLRLVRLHALRDQAREERAGRVYSSDEVLGLITGSVTP